MAIKWRALYDSIFLRTDSKQQTTPRSEVVAMVNAGAGSPVSAAEPDRGPPAAARRLKLAVLNMAAVVAVAVLVDVRGCRGRGCGSSLGGGSVGARDLDRDAVPWPRARPRQTRSWANEATHVKADTVAH